MRIRNLPARDLVTRTAIRSSAGWSTITLAALLLGGGCAPPPEAPEVALADLVDPDVLASAREAAQAMTAGDVTFEGRVWHAPNVYTAFFATPGGGGATLMLGDARAVAGLAVRPRAEPGQHLDDFVNASGIAPTHVLPGIDGEGQEVILFEPRRALTAGGDVGVIQQATVGSGACNDALFVDYCAMENHYYWVGSTAGPNRLGRNFINLVYDTPTNIEAVSAVVCVEEGSINGSAQPFNNRSGFGSAPPWGLLAASAGQIIRYATYGDWRERAICAHYNMHGLCDNVDWRIEFEDYDVDIEVYPWTYGSEFSYCYDGYYRPDYTNYTASCSTAGNCPVVHTPNK